ncbi:hypothetical protein PQX77_020909 [Marasmius sp. AFHP31]|nr:hypothetical protein PQX77_020909 [Marasmius sp. AFHP31]
MQSLSGQTSNLLWTFVSSGNPIPEIAKLELLFDQLQESNIELPDLIKAMLLLSIIPNSWASACEHAIQERALPELTFTVTREIVINHYKAWKPALLATHISSVKKKDKDPKFQQQTSSSSLSSNNNSNNSSNDEKKKNQCRGRKNKGNNQDNKGGSNQGHSHIASFAHLGISSPPIIPESPSVTHPADCNRGPLHMQCFSGATICATVYKNAQSARSFADCLGLLKYAHRGLDGPSSSAPPNKCSKSIEVEEVHDLHDPFNDDSDSEYQERIALNAINASLRTEIVSEANVNMDIADSAGFDDNIEYNLVSIGSNKSDDDRQCAAVLAASKHPNPNLSINMLDLQKYFGKDLFNGKDFIQKYKPAIEGISKTKALWECLIGEWKDIPSPEGSTNSRTVGTGNNAKTETTTTPPSEKEVENWEEKHLPWKRANSQLKGFMQLTLTCDLYIPIKDMTAAQAWTYE